MMGGEAATGAGAGPVCERGGGRSHVRPRRPRARAESHKRDGRTRRQR